MQPQTPYLVGAFAIIVLFFFVKGLWCSLFHRDLIKHHKFGHYSSGLCARHGCDEYEGKARSCECKGSNFL